MDEKQDSSLEERKEINSSLEGFKIFALVCQEIKKRGNFVVNIPKLVDVLFKLGIIESKED